MRIVSSVKLVQGPVDEPATLAEAKVHLRVEHAADDAWITHAIKAARAAFETAADRILGFATFRLHLSRFPDGSRRQDGGANGQLGQEGYEITLPHGAGVDVLSLTYVDANGATQTLSPSAYQVDSAREPMRVLPAYGQSWPTCREQPSSVQIEYRCGEDDIEQLDPRIKQAVLMLVGHWYLNRESVLVGSISKEIEQSFVMLARQLWPGHLY